MQRLGLVEYKTLSAGNYLSITTVWRVFWKYKYMDLNSRHLNWYEHARCVIWTLFLFFLFYVFIYLASLSLCCCAWTSPSCVEQFSSVQSLSRVRLFATPWTAACQVSLSITNSRSSLRLTSIELVMPSNHLILCHPFLLLPSIFPSIRDFSNESALHIRWPKDWSFSFNISPSNEHQDWSPLGWTCWISLQFKVLSRVFSTTTVQQHQFFGAQLSLQFSSHIHIWPLEKP